MSEIYAFKSERASSERTGRAPGTSWCHLNARAHTKNRTDVRVDATKTSAKTTRAGCDQNPTEAGRRDGRARGRQRESAQRKPHGKTSAENSSPTPEMPLLNIMRIML